MSTDETEWRVIPEFCKYEITILGDVRNRRTKKILAEHIDKNTGAYSYSLRRDDYSTTSRHYANLVDSAFPEHAIPKPEPKVKRVVSKRGSWKTVPDYPLYQIHKDGRLRYTKNRAAITPRIVEGVQHVRLSNNSGRQMKTIAQLISNAWTQEKEAA